MVAKKQHGELNAAYDGGYRSTPEQNRSTFDIKENGGQVNPAFELDSPTKKTSNGLDPTGKIVPHTPRDGDSLDIENSPERETWGSGLEFLMSCIAMSVGLGNIWRFPFTAYENGGGAFLIPYIIVLFIIGKPLYFLEMLMGQFSSKGSMKVYDFSPALRGAGLGQTVAVVCVMTYYSSLMALIIFYLVGSFNEVLPWSVCSEQWDDCYPSSGSTESVAPGFKSSSELYFTRSVLREPENIDDGIGAPEWRLTLCLLFSWLCVFLVLLKGVKSSGKAAYFLALFPYVVMLILLVRAVTLPGAKEGIIFFIKPDFARLLDPTVWYAAVTQCFFSLAVCFGNVIMYSSYNQFRHNVYRDAMIVTTLDTFTSLLAGFTIFGILGNLASERGEPVRDVVMGGPQLAFISYPEAISKFKVVPQLFSALFFLMLFVLGIGSNVAMASSIITVIRDKFPQVKHWYAVTGVAVFGFCVAIIYITPGGQFILTLVDHHGGSFIVYILGITEMVAVVWIYGIRRLCDDAEFMLNMKIGLYWRICWAVVTPIFLIIIMLYSLITLEPITYNGVAYPVSGIVCGWLLSAVGIVQLPLLAAFAFYKRRALGSLRDIIIGAFKPRESWGPTHAETKREWIAYKEMKKKERAERQGRSRARVLWDRVLGY